MSKYIVKKIEKMSCSRILEIEVSEEELKRYNIEDIYDMNQFQTEILFDDLELDGFEVIINEPDFSDIEEKIFLIEEGVNFD